MGDFFFYDYFQNEKGWTSFPPEDDYHLASNHTWQGDEEERRFNFGYHFLNMIL